MKVYQVINKIQAALAKTGIAKDSRNHQQGYSFRGIDAFYKALAPLLAEHGLCILPEVIERTVTERVTAKGGLLIYVVVQVRFHFVCAVDASEHIVAVFGESMDSGDKATNKALSAAYKYACMQAFCIPTEGDNDADAHSHEIIVAKPVSIADELKDLIRAKNVSAEECKGWCEAANVERLGELNEHDMKRLIRLIKERV